MLNKKNYALCDAYVLNEAFSVVFGSGTVLAQVSNPDPV